METFVDNIIQGQRSDCFCRSRK